MQLETFKSLVELDYQDPVNGKFNDCTRDVLPELGAEIVVQQSLTDSLLVNTLTYGGLRSLNCIVS